MTPMRRNHNLHVAVLMTCASIAAFQAFPCDDVTVHVKRAIADTRPV